MENKQKDKSSVWDFLKSSSLFTGAAIAFVGYFTNSSLEKMKSSEAHSRLYAELMGKREESESALRKDMFNSIIGSFLRPESASLDEKVLNLELLASNFHESLNLKPLFVHLKKKLTLSQDTDKKEFLDRLDRLAKEITKKQMLVLEGAGDNFSRTIVFERLKQSQMGIKLQEETLKVNDIERVFRIIVLKADPVTKEINVRLEVLTPNDLEGEEDTYVVAEFWVGFFDFPMIDNTRLSHYQRCAIVLTDFTDKSANITMLEFPGSHASLKEKPYYQEVVQNLLKASELNGKSKIK